MSNPIKRDSKAAFRLRLPIKALKVKIIDEDDLERLGQNAVGELYVHIE